MKVRYLLLATLGVGVSQVHAVQAATSADVLLALHKSNWTEISMGRMAQKKGFTQEMRRYGDVLFYDHKAAEKKVVALAKAEKVRLPTIPKMEHEMPTGREFDAAFAQEMVADHKKDVASTKAALEEATDPRLKKLLSDLLPVLEKHLELAQELAQKSTPGS